MMIKRRREKEKRRGKKNGDDNERAERMWMWIFLIEATNFAVYWKKVSWLVDTQDIKSNGMSV
jgi:hypothetical protein